MKRTLLLLPLLCAFACDRSSPAEVETAPAEIGAREPTRVRIVAANLTSGDHQSYDPGHGARILQAIEPDVVLFQELTVGDGGETALRGFVDATFGKDFAVHREQGSRVPNGIVSRFPITERGEWTDPGTSGTRDFVWAKIDLPGARDLWAVSVHFKASTEELDTRTEEARALVAAMKQSIPDDALVVVGGDLNTATADEPCFAELAGVVVTAPPHPADVKGVTGTNASRAAPYDWVLANRALAKESVPVELLGASHPAGLVFDTRVATSPPALADDSAAPGMQHMAVVRDFLVR